MLTKEGSKKKRRVYTRNMEGMGVVKKMEKGKGKEKNERKQKRGEDEEDKDYMEDGEMESQQSWREFVMARMMRIDGAVNVDWIKYHSQLLTTNNIIYVCLSSGLP